MAVPADRPPFNDRLALRLTRAVGTMPMFYALLGWYVAWIGVNLWLGPRAFDRPWSFPLLLFLSNFLQLIWLPALSVGQNVLARGGERREQEMYRLTVQIDRIARSNAVVIESQRAVLDTLVALVQGLEGQTAEIDREVDALEARAAASTQSANLREVVTWVRTLLDLRADVDRLLAAAGIPSNSEEA